MRIVSLCPSLTETLVSLGCADDLVGVTKFCIHPSSITRHLRKVGGTKNPDLPAIRALAPDLIFMNEEENRREDAEALACHFDVHGSCPKTVAEVPALLREIGRRTGREQAAETHAQAIERGLEELDQARAQDPGGFRYAYLIWKKPWMCVGPDTYVSDLFARAGGQNVFGPSDTRYPETSLEALAELEPDVVFLPDEPYPFDRRHRAELAQSLEGVAVECISGDDCCWHGVRTRRGLDLVSAQRLHWAEVCRAREDAPA